MNLNDKSQDIKARKLFQKLEKMDDNNTLEVEHLLKLVHTGNSHLVKPLQILKENQNWLTIHDNLIVNATARLIPFGTWADIICVYFEKGIGGLVECVIKRDVIYPFAISVLEELKSKESFKALSDLLISCSLPQDEGLIMDIINAINMMASFKNPPEIDDSVAVKTVLFIQGVIDYFSNTQPIQNDKVASCLLSLRGIGNDSTILFLQKLHLRGFSVQTGGAKSMTMWFILDRVTGK